MSPSTKWHSATTKTLSASSALKNSPSSARTPRARSSATAHWPNSSVRHSWDLSEPALGTNPRSGSILPMQGPIFVLRLPSSPRTVLNS